MNIRTRHKAAPNKRTSDTIKKISKMNDNLDKIRAGKMGGGMMGRRMGYKDGSKKFPDLTGDGKVTQADILKGRGVFNRGGGAGQTTREKVKFQLDKNIRKVKEKMKGPTLSDSQKKQIDTLRERMKQPLKRENKLAGGMIRLGKAGLKYLKSKEGKEKLKEMSSEKNKKKIKDMASKMQKAFGGGSK